MSDNSNMGSDRSTVNTKHSVDTKLGCNGEVWKLLNMAQNLNGIREQQKRVERSEQVYSLYLLSPSLSHSLTVLTKLTV